MKEMLQTFAKSALLDSQVEDKLNRGASAIEMQLIGDLEEAGSAQALYDMHKELIERTPFMAVHAPLRNEEDMELEAVYSRPWLIEVCKLAQMIAEQKGHEIIVIIHMSTAVSHLRRLGLLDSLVEYTRFLADDNPNIRIGIENTTTYDCSFKTNTMRHCCSYTIEDGQLHSSNIDFVNEVDHPRVGIVVDYCHAMMATKMVEDSFSFLGSQFMNIYHGSPTEDIFMKSAPKTILYHLAWGNESGYGSQHGLPFHDNDERENAILAYFVKLYKQCCEIAGKTDGEIPITLEVREDNFLDSVNYSATKKALSKYYSLE